MENQMIAVQMQMNNMIPNNNIGNNINNNNYIENNINDNKFFGSKKSIMFKSIKGDVKVLTFDYGTTISEMLKKYLEEIGKPHFFNSDEIRFICSSVKLNFNDKTKIEDKFVGKELVTIIVHDSKPLIGG